MDLSGLNRANLLLEIIATELYIARTDREYAQGENTSWHLVDRDLAVDTVDKMRGKLSPLPGALRPSAEDTVEASELLSQVDAVLDPSDLSPGSTITPM